MYAVTSIWLLSFTRATLRSAEFGFLGVVVYTRVHTPRRCGAATFFLRPLPDFRPGVESFVGFGVRPLRTSWLVVGMRRSMVAAGAWRAGLRSRREHQGGDHRSRLRSRLILVGVRAVEQVAAMHERRRPAAVEVDRLPRAERDHQPRQLPELEPGVHARPAAVAADSDQLVIADTECAPRVAPYGDVGVELPGSRREPL